MRGASCLQPNNGIDCLFLFYKCFHTVQPSLEGLGITGPSHDPVGGGDPPTLPMSNRVCPPEGIRLGRSN